MSATTQTAPPAAATVQPPAVSNGNGKAAQRTAGRPKAAKSTAPASAAAPAPEKKPATPAQLAARNANIAKGRQARTAAAATSAPGINTPPPVIQALMGDLPARGTTWSAQEASSFIAAMCSTLSHTYRLGVNFTVTSAPAAA